MSNAIRSALPEADIVHEDSLEIDSRNLDFFIFEIPGGGTIFDAISGTRDDVHRASIAFIQGKFAYTITTNKTIKKEGDPPEIKTIKKELLEILAGMTFPEKS